MALVGNLERIEYTDHPTETSEWKYVDEYGEEINKVAPKKIKTATTYSDAYLGIKQVDLFTQCCGEDPTLVFTYAIYASQEDRNADVNNFIYEETDMLFNYNHDTNLFSQVYSKINSKEGYTNLIEG